MGGLLGPFFDFRISLTVEDGPCKIGQWGLPGVGWDVPRGSGLYGKGLSFWLVCTLSGLGWPRYRINVFMVLMLVHICC